MKGMKLLLVALAMFAGGSLLATRAEARGGGPGPAIYGQGQGTHHAVKWGRGGKPLQALPGHANKGGAERGLVRGGAVAGPHGVGGRLNAVSHGAGQK